MLQCYDDLQPSSTLSSCYKLKLTELNMCALNELYRDVKIKNIKTVVHLFCFAVNCDNGCQIKSGTM